MRTTCSDILSFPARCKVMSVSTTRSSASLLLLNKGIPPMFGTARSHGHTCLDVMSFASHL